MTSLDEPALVRAELLLWDQVGKALDGDPAPERMHLQVRAGNPSEELIRLGRSADLLVVGSRGHGGFHYLLTGRSPPSSSTTLRARSWSCPPGAPRSDRTSGPHCRGRAAKEIHLSSPGVDHTLT